MPDKEFRYLRTVIVTAAVYWDFDQELAPHQLIFQHRAGITPYTSTFSLQSAVFLVNSRSHRFSETSSRSGCFFLHATEAHLIPKLRCQFAEFLLLSSLKRLSIFSSPTSVGLRYGPVELRGFSWEPIRSLRSIRTSMLHLGDLPADLPAGLLRSQTGTSNTRMIFNTPSPLRTQRRSRNINLVPISYASQPRLRGRLTLLR